MRALETQAAVRSNAQISFPPESLPKSRVFRRLSFLWGTDLRGRFVGSGGVVIGAVQAQV
jgi:hypothetical protein